MLGKDDGEEEEEVGDGGENVETGGGVRKRCRCRVKVEGCELEEVE